MPSQNLKPESELMQLASEWEKLGGILRRSPSREATDAAAAEAYETCAKYLREVLAAVPALCLQEASPQQGQLPAEPTEEMSIAGRKALALIADRMETAKLLATSSIDFWQRVGHKPADEIYKAMIAAAPVPIQEEGGGKRASDCCGHCVQKEGR